MAGKVEKEAGKTFMLALGVGLGIAVFVPLVQFVLSKFSITIPTA